MPGSRRDWIRRRLGAVALIVAIGLLVKVAFDQGHPTDVTIVVDFGGHGAEIRHVRADVFVGGEPADAFFEGTYPDGVRDPVQFAARIPDGEATLRVDLTTTAGPRRLERRLTVMAGARVTVDLGRDLDRPAP